MTVTGRPVAAASGRTRSTDLFATLVGPARGRRDRPERLLHPRGRCRPYSRAPVVDRGGATTTSSAAADVVEPGRARDVRRARRGPELPRAEVGDAVAGRDRSTLVRGRRVPLYLALLRARDEHAFGQRCRPASLVAVSDSLVVRGAREHNLKNIGIELPRDQLIVFTGLSGSGKSSLAFDTIYAEGQRRYVESLSSYARQFLGPDGQARRRLHRGAVAGHLDRPEVGLAQPALHRRHHHRGLRLPPAALRPDRRAPLPRVRRADHAADPAADRRPHPRAPRGHALPGARPGGARSQGHLRDPAHRPRRPGLRPRPHRRRGARAHGQGRPGALRAAHHRGDRRSARGAGRSRATAHGLARDGAPARRRRGRGAAGAARRRGAWAGRTTARPTTR